MKPVNGWKRKPEADQDDTTGRCNFRLPIKTFNLMLEMAKELGIESTSGAARHFCLKGIELSMAQYAAYRASLNSAKMLDQGAQSVSFQGALLAMMQGEEKEEKEEDPK